ncbi:putative transcription factor SSXT family [Medicago truncatula]|uniref:Putative transcription factor SSXT family n=1 Tax=Medicago truncatula TaxID=3880 RepID=G7L8M4_MEDTR|nr:SSXT protein (amino-terminal region) protein [Medicago truncatula]RHN41817.1 putative transcription factor SSXT family [Medicago truncatula]
MMNADPSLPVLTTEQIQKCLEENEELIMAILEGQKQGKHGELAPYQAKLQHNLTFQLQQQHLAMSLQQPDLSASKFALQMVPTTVACKQETTICQICNHSTKWDQT